MGDPEEEMDLPQKLFLSVAEHFRTAVLPNQSGNWRNHLPILPCTAGELKEVLENQYRQDEMKVLTQLAQLGSTSAQIITSLELTRDIVEEALHELRGERRAQCNLLDILSAARYKTITNEGLMDTHCPLQACRARDSFAHMLGCYDLIPHLEKGPSSTSFLLRMARKTQILDVDKPRPYRPN